MSTLLFDSKQNLLWGGDTSGVVKSYSPQRENFSPNLTSNGFQLSQYSSFVALADKHPIKQFLSHQQGIISLLENCVTFHNRRGLPKWVAEGNILNDPLFCKLSSMAMNTVSSNNLIVGGDLLFCLDTQKLTSATKFNHAKKVSLVKHGLKYLCLGNANGEVEIFDPSSNSSVKSFYGHSGLMSDLDVQGNYIASCGYSLRPKRGSSINSLVVDPLVNLYDLRMMKPLAPISFQEGASFVKFHPKLSNICVIASSSGQIHFVDIFDPLKVYFYQADLGNISPSVSAFETYLDNLSVSENGEFIVFNDGAQNIHLWTFESNNESNFVNFPDRIEEADVVVQPKSVNLNEGNIPLSSIGMPFYKDILLSSYGSDLVFTKELLKLPRKLDPELLVNDKGMRFLPYDRERYGARNVYQNYDSLRNKIVLREAGAPKFISERSENEEDIELQNNIFQHLLQDKFSVPNCYTNLKIQYSKFGVEDFDFQYYNRTQYSGLENHLDNSYINSLLQIYKYVPQFQNYVLKFLLKEWLPNDEETILEKRNTNGSSILNELGYFFDMLNKSQGKNCNISNFAEVLNQNQLARMHGLINYDDTKHLNSFSLQKMVCHFNAFLLNVCDSDLSYQFSDSLEKISGVYCALQAKSNGCEVSDLQYRYYLSVDLSSSFHMSKAGVLLKPNLSTPIGKNRWNIVKDLEYTLSWTKSVGCNQCNNYFPHTIQIRQAIVKLPPVLSINLNFSAQDYKNVRFSKGWLIPEFYAEKNSSGITFKSSESVGSLKTNLDRYELLGYVCEINHGSEFSEGKHNVVSFIRIYGEWYLFNDFLVMPIPVSEVFNLSYEWKKPLVVLYCKAENDAFESFQKETFFKLPNLNDSILYREHFVEGKRKLVEKEYKLLTRKEAPLPGTLVAIDAEFVALMPEELEVFYTGKKNTIKPRKLSLARVSALRCDGPDEGVPFIDDYIVHTGFIEDYLTNFSGIEPNDLDIHESQKSLVTLQVAYRRLWLLLNLGCIFVGHGLQNDFRIINLNIPRDQIRDTAEIYYIPEWKRKLSLKFLAYMVLKDEVQKGNHDSIEDARTALKLYKKYSELSSSGEFMSTLQRIYIEGQQLRFKVPDTSV